MTEIKSEKLYMKFQSILSELTPQTIQALGEEALKLDITKEKQLRVCVEQIVSKVRGSRKRSSRKFIPLPTQSHKESNSSIVCANLCKVMSPIKVEMEVEGKVKSTNFRIMLLTKCQWEFETLLTMLQSIKEAKTV